jgi:hypothetical protein
LYTFVIVAASQSFLLFAPRTFIVKPSGIGRAVGGFGGRPATRIVPPAIRNWSATQWRGRPCVSLQTANGRRVLLCYKPDLRGSDRETMLFEWLDEQALAARLSAWRGPTA